jgi:excisionase family DNA binding protein
MSDLITLAEAAKHLRVSANTVYKFCRSGELRARKVGRQWRILKDDLERLLAHQHEGSLTRPKAGADPLVK